MGTESEIMIHSGHSNPGALAATREAVRLGYALHLHDNARAADEWAAFLRHGTTRGKWMQS